MTPETSRDHADCLIDQLLREVLGGDRPRDLTQRVLVQAKAYDKTRRWWWAGTAMSLAASVAIIATVWAAWPRAYPTPVANGTYNISGNGVVQRGAYVETASNESATIQLGGYVQVAVAPETAFSIGGDKFKEKIILDHGQLDVGVNKKVGTFEVAVGEATVRVTGTHFSVKAFDEVDEATQTSTRKMTVNVTDGSVWVDGIPKPGTLSASVPRGNLETFVLWTNKLGTESPVAGGGKAPTPGENTPTPTPPAATPGGSRSGSTMTHVNADGSRSPRSGTPVTGDVAPPVQRTRPDVQSPAPVGSTPPPEGAEPQAPGGQP